MSSTPWNAAWHLNAELARILDGLARQLGRQRQRGRTAAGDAVRGLVIEEGEAEGLIAELSRDLTGGRETPERSRQLRAEIEARADQGASLGAFLPLRHALKAFDLAPEEYDALILALAVEVESRFGRIVAYLNDHVGRTRPTLGLALSLAGDEIGRYLSAVGLESRPFLHDGLLELEGEGPLPGLSIRVPKALAARLAGAGTGREDPGIRAWPVDQSLLSRLVLHDAFERRLKTWGEELRATRRARPLLIAGSPGSGRATAGRAALFLAGVAVVQTDLNPENVSDRLRVARREARWHGAALVVRAQPPTSPAAFDWAAIWRALPADRPVVIALPPDQVAEATASAPAEPSVVSLEEPAVPQRVRLWQALLPRGDRLEESELSELAARFPFGPGRIARSVRRAVGDLSLRPAGERSLDLPALLDAARAVDSASIGPLAQKLPLPFERSELVVPPHVASELDLAVAWVRHRHRVLHDWGFVRRVPMGHGLTALFAGPSGTGKTMAAQVLARELDLDLYRIDASQLVSKWVGETEKNIAMAFGARVGVLFFDEADALFGKRGEAKSPQDRWANIEVGYLLQRMEEYDGVTVLATNRMQDMDEAFLRRLHVVVDFPMPLEADRLRIWQGMFPAGAERAEDIDLASLAREFEISGGEIKNAVLAAAYMAAAEAKPIGMEHLRRAATRELVKSGKVVER